MIPPVGRRIRVLLLAAAPLLAQVPTISIDPQGSQFLRDTTGHVVKGMQLLAVSVTSPVPVRCTGADVQAAITSAMFSVLGDNATALELSRAASHDWRNGAVIGLPVALSLGTAFVGSDLIHANDTSRQKITAGLGFGAAASAALIPLLRADAPSPAPVLAQQLRLWGATPVDARPVYVAPFGGYVGARYPSPGPVVVPIRCQG